MRPMTRLNRITGGDHGQSHVAEFAEGAGAVDVSHFVQGLRHIRQARQEDHHRSAHAPETHENEGRLGPMLVRQPPRTLNAEDRFDGGIQQSVLRIQHPEPQHRGRDDGNDGGKEENLPVDRLATDLETQEHGQSKRKRKPERHGKRSEIQRVVQGFPETRIFEKQSVVVVRADPHGRPDHVVALQAIHKRHHEGIRVDDEKTQHKGRREKHRVSRIASFHSRHRTGSTSM